MLENTLGGPGHKCRQTIKSQKMIKKKFRANWIKTFNNFGIFAKHDAKLDAKLV